MGKLIIEINTDNAAFEGADNLLDVLRSCLPIRIQQDEDGRIFDYNGNRVGYWEWK